MKHRILFFLIFFNIFNINGFAQDRNKISFFTEVGLVLNSSFEKSFRTIYDDYEISGSTIWIDLGFSIPIKISDNIFIVPKIKMLATSIKFNTYGDFAASGKATAVFMGGSSVKYSVPINFLSEKKPYALGRYSFYMDLDFGVNKGSSDLSRIDVNTDGYHLGFFVGINADRFAFDVGYLYIPGEVVEKYYSRNKINWGGFSIAIHYGH